MENSLDNDDGCQIEAQVLRVQVGLEAVGKALLLTRSKFNPISVGGKIANDARIAVIERPQASADKLNGDGLGLLAHEGEDRFIGFAVGDLDTEDFSVREGSLHGYSGAR